MTNDKLRYLHLSDLHLSADQALNQGIVTRSLLDALGSKRTEPLDFIVITGDIAFAGSAGDYEAAAAFCDELLEVTNIPRKRLYLTPGNHDVRREKVSQTLRILCEGLKSQDDIDAVLRDQSRELMHKFVDFNRFAERMDEHAYFVETLRLTKDGQTAHIELLGLNSALLAGYDGDDQQKLALGLAQVDAALQRRDKNADLSIGFFHHPFECFHPRDRESCRNRLIHDLDLLLTGHLHQPDNLYTHEAAGQCLLINAGAGFETRESHNSFNIVEIDLHTRQGRVAFFKYLHAHNVWVKHLEAAPHDPDGFFSFTLKPSRKTTSVKPQNAKTGFLPRKASNPYTPASSRLFYGRERLMRALLRDEEAGQSVVFIGGRRCGKTRVLEQLRAYLRTDTEHQEWREAVPDAAGSAPAQNIAPHWPIPVNFQGLTFASLEHALQHIARAVRKHGPPELPDLPTQCDSSALNSWLIQADLALDRMGGIALLIDEIEELFNKPWCHDLMSFLRRLDDFSLKTRLWIVLAGSDALHGYRFPKDGSHPLNTSRRIFLTDLDHAARRRMATEPFKRAGRPPPSDEALRELDRIAAGNPWILTLMLEAVFHADESTPEIVRRAEDSLLDQLDAVCQHWAKALDDIGGWELYNEAAAKNALFKGRRGRAVRILLEYQSLVHRNNSGGIEMGPEFFYHWAREEEKF
ncbi:MAG: hypothetical protein GY862_38450 [Gammaproteobacteria bacterium]|nr:hypothetical protein [Gammaproteobacteria bacterium]